MNKLMIIGAVILAICGSALAQSGFMDQVNVHFSNPVVVNGTTIPAGDCNIQVLRGSSDNLVLAVRSQSGVAAQVLVNRMDEMELGNTVKDAQVILAHTGN